jgi:hypothetical protein
MREAEGRGIDYLFKLRLTKNAKILIERTLSKGGWRDAGQGWQSKTEALLGWSRQRRVVVLRRRLKVNNSLTSSVECLLRMVGGTYTPSPACRCAAWRLQRIATPLASACLPSPLQRTTNKTLPTRHCTHVGRDLRPPVA